MNPGISRSFGRTGKEAEGLGSEAREREGRDGGALADTCFPKRAGTAHLWLTVATRECRV